MAIMDRIASPYTYCDTLATLHAALFVLRASQALVLDCEGDKLGVAGGTLSLILIGCATTVESFHPFIIDVLAFSRQELLPLLHLLRSNHIVKIMFDGRMDYSALHHGYNIPLQNVLDLQLADLIYRMVQEETIEERMQRLSPFIPDCAWRADRQMFQNIIKLSSMKECVRLHMLEAPPKGDVDHSGWLQRPLTERHLTYAARDITLIHELSVKLAWYLHYVHAESMRYVTLWRHRQPKSGDPYTGHPLLPANIIRHTQLEQRTALAPLRVCDKCRRHLPRHCFSTEWDWNMAKRGRKGQCEVCRVITVRAQWYPYVQGRQAIQQAA